MFNFIKTIISKKREDFVTLEKVNEILSDFKDSDEFKNKVLEIVNERDFETYQKKSRSL